MVKKCSVHVQPDAWFLDVYFLLCSIFSPGKQLHAISEVWTCMRMSLVSCTWPQMDNHRNLIVRVLLNGGFPKWGYLQIIQFNGIFPL